MLQKIIKLISLNDLYFGPENIITFIKLSLVSMLVNLEGMSQSEDFYNLKDMSLTGYLELMHPCPIPDC